MSSAFLMGLLKQYNDMRPIIDDIITNLRYSNESLLNAKDNISSSFLYDNISADGKAILQDYNIISSIIGTLEGTISSTIDQSISSLQEDIYAAQLREEEERNRNYITNRNKSTINNKRQLGRTGNEYYWYWYIKIESMRIGL